MNRILKLIVDDYQNQPTVTEYKLVLHRFCDVEKQFMSTLNKKQKAEYLKLDIVSGELSVVEQNELVKYVFDCLMNNFSKP